MSAHVVILVEQLTSVGFIVEIVGKATHHIIKIISHSADELKVVAFVDYMPGKGFSAVTFPAVCFLDFYKAQLISKIWKLTD